MPRDYAGDVVTIIDVAREAGVSPATVSRALNGAKVDPELAERARAAAERLGYRANAMARNLRRRKTDVIALVISDVANPFFTAIARGVEDVAQRAGYSVLLCNADENPGKEARYLDVAIAEQVAGIVLSPHAATTSVERVLAAGVPLVVVDRPLDVPVDSVLVRSAPGARAATEHLLAQGWRHTACIPGPPDAATALDRLAGYRAAVGGDGVHAFAGFDIDGGAAAAAAVLDTGGVDALLVGNAQMTLGVLAEIERRGLVVGRDLGLVTFDDAPWARFIDPAITVVSQPASEIGERAAELLLRRVYGDTSPVEAVEYGTRLVVRASSLRR